MICYSILKTSSVGGLLLVAGAAHLNGIYYLNQKHAPVVQQAWMLKPKHHILMQAAEEIRDYLHGARTTFSVPLHYSGTTFQEDVWRHIALIPFGQTITYTELARRVGAPAAIRAAGTATGKNPLSIVLPCHRVVAKDGSLGGYAGGLERKQLLLQMEKRALGGVA